MQKIEDMIRKYNSGECTAEEKIWLEQWYQSFEWNNESDTIHDGNIKKLKEEVWLALQNSKTPAEREVIPPAISMLSKSIKAWYYAAAAVTIAAIAVISFYLSRPSKESNAVNHVATKQDINSDVLPGTSKAQLVLSNGNVVSLDSARNMQLKEEDGTYINKESGKLVYNDNAGGNGKILFNTLSTPRGGEYQLVLPDGSKVWLNAASSIKFPTRFGGNERTVFVHGEAYFEVTKNKEVPFQVKLDNDMTVQVVGTHFNIMAYGDESVVRTTLAEGIVKVISPVKTVLLSPSKQAIMKRGDQSLTVSNADVSKALAWKNGMIEFDGDDLPYIMRQLSRWYDVDVNFAGAIPKGTYKGTIHRQSPLSKVLEILRVAGVQFKMNDKKLIVTGG
jgi:transmembrane sensor